MIKIYIDGSSPKEKIYPSAYCIFKEKKLIYSKVLEENLPAQDVEYLALIETLNLIKEEIITDDKIEIYTDCGWMVQELNFVREPKNIKLFNKARELLNLIKIDLKLIVISRTKNIAGKYLEKRLYTLRDDIKSTMNPKPNPRLKWERKRKKYRK